MCKLGAHFHSYLGSSKFFFVCNTASAEWYQVLGRDAMTFSIQVQCWCSGKCCLGKKHKSWRLDHTLVQVCAKHHVKSHTQVVTWIIFHANAIDLIVYNYFVTVIASFKFIINLLRNAQSSWRAGTLDMIDIQGFAFRTLHQCSNSIYVLWHWLLQIIGTFRLITI